VKTLTLSDPAYNHLERDVWDTATNTTYLPEWWETAYVTRSGERFFVCAVEGAQTTRRILTKRQLVEAYLSIENPTHCGGSHLLYDADSCSADLILQQAVFNAQVFG